MSGSLCRPQLSALSVLADNCDDVARIITDIGLFGPDGRRPGSHSTSHRDYLAIEVGVLLGAIDYAIEVGVIAGDEIAAIRARSLDSLRRRGSDAP